MPKPSRPGAPASRSIQPPAPVAADACLRQGALVVGGDVHGAHADLGQPAHAGGVEAGASAGSADGRTEIRPRCGPSGHAGAAARAAGAPIRLRSASTSAATPSRSTCVVVPSHAMHDGR